MNREEFWNYAANVDTVPINDCYEFYSQSFRSFHCQYGLTSKKSCKHYLHICTVTDDSRYLTKIRIDLIEILRVSMINLTLL